MSYRSTSSDVFFMVNLYPSNQPTILFSCKNFYLHMLMIPSCKPQQKNNKKNQNKTKQNKTKTNKQTKTHKTNHTSQLQAFIPTYAHDTQQNSYSISHLLGTVTTQWLPLWRCSHCSLVPDTVTTEQWLYQTHTLLGIHYHGAYVEICLLGT